MRLMAAVTVLAMGLAATGMQVQAARGAAQAAPAAVPDAEPMAAGMRRSLPIPAGPGMIVDARAEGNLLILTIEAPTERITGVAREVIAGAFATGFCRQHGRAFFEAGYRIRVDPKVPGSSAVTGIVTDRCPETPVTG